MGNAAAKEREEEQFVRERLRGQYGVRLRKIPESKRAGQKSADFELLVSDVRVAVMEVKRLIRTPRTTENKWSVSQSNGICTASRWDNAPQRIAKAIDEAWDQLQGYRELKIVTFVNDETVADVGDLEEAFNGYKQYRNAAGINYTNSASWRIANGKIRALKRRIDLFIWIDRAQKAEAVFRIVTAEGHELARQCFGCPDLGKPPGGHILSTEVVNG